MLRWPANLLGVTRWGEAVLWATALTSGLTSGESAVRLVVGRVPARCGCGEGLGSGIDLLSMDWYAEAYPTYA